MTKQKVVELFKDLKPERKRHNIPKRIVDAAIKEVDRIPRIPFKHKQYTDMFWGDNPNKENPLTIDLPRIEVDELIPIPQDFIKSAVFYDVKKLREQGIKIVKESCVITHKGEIIIVYITAKKDKAIKMATERVADLAKGFEKYYPVKADTFYTPFKLVKGTAQEKAEALAYKSKQRSVSRYFGKNWMDGMIKYFIGLKKGAGGTMVAYQPRKPEAEEDESFLYDLVYTYMALYELEKRYCPDVAAYRLKLATEAGFPGAFPGVPLSRHCATGVGASLDFSSAIHNDSGIKGLSETIIWNTPKLNEKQYFVSPTIKMCFDLTDSQAIIFQPPKIPHSTVQTGDHNGIGLVNITKQNLVAKTDINKQYYDLYKKSFSGRGMNQGGYVIAIPTYDRVDILLQDTLPMLLRQGVPPKNIDIFVANKEQEELYKSAVPQNNYNKLVVGVKGLGKQLQFIKDYYPQGKHIIRMDDDISSVFKKKGDNDTMEFNLNKFIVSSFKKLKELGLTLWSVNKVANPFFMTDGYSTDLRLISGNIQGYINSNNPSYDFKIKNNYTAEDIERTLRHYITDGGVLRFNDYGFKTKPMNVGGIQSDLGSNKQRIIEVRKATTELKKLYSNYGDIVPHKDQGVVFKLHKNPLEIK